MSSAVQHEIIQLLQGIFRETFEDESIVLTPETTAEDIEPWDSLSNIEIMVGVEAVTGIRFAAAELADLANIGELAALIASKRG